MEIKAMLVSRWAASVLDLHQPRRKREKRWYRERERERERVREREREREKMQMNQGFWSSRLVSG